MSPELQLQLAKISVTDFKAGVDQAETEATRHATELADKEYEAECHHLEAEANNAARSLATAKTVHEVKETDLHDHAILVGSLDQDNKRAQAKLRASSQKHEAQIAHLNSPPPPPPTSAHPTMPPPPPRSSSAAAARTERRTQPDTWATVASGNYHAPQPIKYDDSYLDVRVSAFRHRNDAFPQAIRDRTFDLSTAVYTAPTNQTDEGLPPSRAGLGVLPAVTIPPGNRRRHPDAV